MLKENKFHSFNQGNMPKGCQFCVKGEKLVLFVTGVCPRKCYFCPVSDEKYGKDVIFANEQRSFTSEDVIKEAEKMQAKGVGITGGDPLAKLDRTTRFIKKLKEHFGKDFHAHLYTSLRLVNDDNLQKLYMSGLDEIRFHPDLDSDSFWKRIDLATKFPWEVGIEAPLIPGKEKEFKQLIDFIQDKVMFLNLNELEVADNSQSKLLEMGFKTKDQFSYAIEGSLELGLSLIKYIKEKGYHLKVHLCTAKLKDSVQLAERIKREAQGTKKVFDLVDNEGLLTRGALYLEELKPGVGYRESLKQDQKESIQKLNKILLEVKENLQLKDEDLFLDTCKPRILLSKKHVKLNKKKLISLGLVPAIVTEYPTADQLEMEVEFLT
ncbi:radical SAM protein [Candidatus Woesearchaeota archaeon CG_4_10_14_0_2_um_filter_33_13]|nr:MAG: radical SAM protein [Candidatus Woesearchaeota archaeon CG_4_10_14_0_2_um_filter_33_13]